MMRATSINSAAVAIRSAGVMPSTVSDAISFGVFIGNDFCSGGWTPAVQGNKSRTTFFGDLR